jgi:hypothetical protein
LTYWPDVNHAEAYADVKVLIAGADPEPLYIRPNKKIITALSFLTFDSRLGDVYESKAG